MVATIAKPCGSAPAGERNRRENCLNHDFEGLMINMIIPLNKFIINLEVYSRATKSHLSSKIQNPKSHLSPLKSIPHSSFLVLHS